MHGSQGLPAMEPVFERSSGQQLADEPDLCRGYLWGHADTCTLLPLRLCWKPSRVECRADTSRGACRAVLKRMHGTTHPEVHTCEAEKVEDSDEQHRANE